MTTKKQDASAAGDENLGLAKLVHDLHAKVDKTFEALRREIGTLREENGRLHDRNAEQQKTIRELTRDRLEMRTEQSAFHNEAKDSAMSHGRAIRLLTDRVDALEQVRKVAADPHQVVKPLLREIGELRDKVARLTSRR